MPAPYTIARNVIAARIVQRGSITPASDRVQEPFHERWLVYPAKRIGGVRFAQAAQHPAPFPVTYVVVSESIDNPGPQQGQELPAPHVRTQAVPTSPAFHF